MKCKDIYELLKIGGEPDWFIHDRFWDVHSLWSVFRSCKA